MREHLVVENEALRPLSEEEWEEWIARPSTAHQGLTYTELLLRAQGRRPEVVEVREGLL